MKKPIAKRLKLHRDVVKILVVLPCVALARVHGGRADDKSERVDTCPDSSTICQA